MTERPIKFWKFTLVLIIIMIGLALSKPSFGAGVSPGPCGAVDPSREASISL